jgi:hypothetical protein
MIWAILVLLGVPLWLCAMGILALLLRNRGLRRRPGNVPVRVLRRKRWSRGHGVWVSDVFAWRGSPAAWQEDSPMWPPPRLAPPSRANARHCFGWARTR